MDNITIAGKPIRLTRPERSEIKGLWLGLVIEFELFRFAMNGQNLLLLLAKGKDDHSPLQRSNIARKIEAITGMPAVFYFDRMTTNERDRLVDRGVYFVVGNQFAFLPTLLSNRRMSREETTSKFYPSTQYILLFHLQQRNINSMSISEISEITPYHYVTIAKSLRQLKACGLAEITTESNRTKRLHFTLNGRKLWDEAQKYLTNPIKRSGYTSAPLTEGKIGGIEALAQYSMLSGEEVPTRVLTDDELKASGMTLSPYEEAQRVEAWKYPPVSSGTYVDKLSLYLTLKDDNDPRVEKELETMLNEIKW